MIVRWFYGCKGRAKIRPVQMFLQIFTDFFLLPHIGKGRVKAVDFFLEGVTKKYYFCTI